MNAPRDSVTFKNNGGQLSHRFTFTFNKTFHAATEQEEVFNLIVLPKLKDFMEGRNQLIFTYGTTSSGKTYTIQGDEQNPGILPRALHAILWVDFSKC